jgi:hypothetical protein
MVDWRLLAADFVSNTIKAELPVAFGFGRTINGATKLSGSIGQDHPKATLANMDPGRTALYAERSGRVVWGGIILDPLRRSMGSRELSFEAVDWVGYLARRNIRHTLAFDQDDQFDIVRGIIDYLQSNQNLGILVDSQDSGVLRDRTYPFYERKNAASALTELSDVVDGFDFTSDTTRDNATDIITKHVRLYYPRRGRRTNHVLSYNEDGSTNIDDYGYSLDPSRMENQVDGFGAGDKEDRLIATAADPNQWTAYPILDGVEMRDSVTELATLQGHTARRLQARSRLVELLSVKLKANAKPSFSSWVPGDQLTVRVDDPPISVDGFWRVISDSVAVSDSGDETVTLLMERPEATL